MILIIAEKPSLGRNIAAALGNFSRRDGYLENEQCIVTWAFGHLFSLADIEKYNPRPENEKYWTMKNLPCFPENFCYELRTEKGLSQAALAEAVGVSRNTISSIETGQYSPTAKLAYALCLVLDKKFEQVFYFEGESAPSSESDLSSAENAVEGGGIPDKTLNRLMRYLTEEGWSAEKILDMIVYLTK